MKRIIDMRSVGDGSQFSVWCTVADSFDTVMGEQAWNCVADFVECWEADPRRGEEYRDRILGLLPSWVAR